jgi:AraC-like DNA-binding protein
MFTPRTSEGPQCSVQRRFLPSADLCEYIRWFEYRETMRGDDTPHPLAFSVLPFVSFYLGSRCAVFERDRGERRLLPRISVVGPCDHRVADFSFGSNFRSLRVVFEPTGFFRLFRLSPATVLNLAHDGVDVLGSRAAELYARLMETRHPEQMVELAEQTLRTWLTNALPRSGIQLAADRLLNCKGRSDLPAIARSIGLSDSSWRRHFSAEVGVTPKRYFRMLRFEHAVALKLKFSDWAWTNVCLESGYYDQAHFIADCQIIARCTPSKLMREIAAMPAPLADAFYGRATESSKRVRAVLRNGDLQARVLREAPASNGVGKSGVGAGSGFLSIGAA